MASFFNQIASAVATNLVNALTNSSSTDPIKVIEVSSSTLHIRSILKREQCLVMYGSGGGVQGFELTMAITGGRDKVYR